MNKVIQINLGGLPFTFDEDAYADLDDYLARLDGYFRGSPGHSEIMHDIESRLAELFGQGTKGRAIVGTTDVCAAIATLGQPEDLGASFSDDEAEEVQEPSHRKSNGRRSRRANDKSYGYSSYGRRLMRDPEDKVVSGVCSGLAAYFGTDVVWVRVAFAAAFFGAGVGLLPYIILWIVMPEARSAADRLAMRGAPLDLQSISQQVEYEATQFTDRVRDWGDDVKRNGWQNPFHSNGKGSRNERPARNSGEARKRYSDKGYVA